MRERADSIGATIDWTDPPAGGCEVRLSVAPATSVATPPTPAAAGMGTR